MFFVEPPRSSWDINFVMFGIPVRIAPYFWLLGLFFGMNLATPAALLAWMAAFLLSILIHELGHAVAFRSFGYYPMITLYAMGGLTAPDSYGAEFRFFRPSVDLRSGAGRRDPRGCLALERARAGRIRYGVPMGSPERCLSSGESAADQPDARSLRILVPRNQHFLGIHEPPARLSARWRPYRAAILLQLNPRTGLRDSLVLSVVAAGAVAVAALVEWREWYLAAMFAFLAYSSYAELNSARRGPWW